eukprot:7470178-Ditylum_brightwellii.AAC.1
MEKNIGWFPLPSTPTLGGISQWLDQPKIKCTQTSSTYILILRKIEGFIWYLIDKGFGNHSFDDSDIDNLVKIVDCYRSTLHEFHKRDECKALMQVELTSQELLIVWAVYCLIHATAKHKHKEEMEKFGVALNFEDLRHLVLSDKRAIDMVQK